MEQNNINRRKFIKKTGLLGSVLLIEDPLKLMDYSLSNQQIINIGVIGTGSRGTGLMRILREVSQIKIMACCDILPWRLEDGMSFADANAVPYHDYRMLLEDKNLDAIIIATPLFSHCSIALEALDAGKHVYCEKTMTYDSEQAYRVLHKSKGLNKLIFQVGYQYRSSELYCKVVDMVRNGYIGKVTGYHCQWNRNGDWRRHSPNSEHEKMINWRMYRDYSKGLLGELSSHQIDFVNWITGAHPISAVGTGGIDYWKDGRETYDNIHVAFDYPDGVKALFTCTTANAYNGYRIKILGDKATVVLKPDKAWIYPEYTENEYDTIDGVTGATVNSSTKIEKIPINISPIEPSRHAIVDFANNILHSEMPESNVFTGFKANIAVEMAFQSIIQDRRVLWSEF